MNLTDSFSFIVISRLLNRVAEIHHSFWAGHFKKRPGACMAVDFFFVLLSNLYFECGILDFFSELALVHQQHTVLHFVFLIIALYKQS